mmetsp:Transcript_14891/g.27943  ORF Transcript_14891/g.27943 Transcript_14891/m.27943 type:complete len:99 (+) Transcript_14891:87-383(+)
MVFRVAEDCPIHLNPTCCENLCVFWTLSWKHEVCYSCIHRSSCENGGSSKISAPRPSTTAKSDQVSGSLIRRWRFPGSYNLGGDHHRGCIHHLLLRRR